MTKIEVVGLGALNMDYLYRIERILDDGEAVVKELILSPGGSAANTIYGLAKLGVNTGFAGVVGADEDGRLLVQDFQKVGVDTSQIRVKPRTKTGSVLCLSDSLGKRSLYVSPGANSLLTTDDLDVSYINQARLLHLSSFADDRQLKLSAGLMNKLNPSIKVSFSPGALHTAKGLKALTPILARTYVLFVNYSEMRRLTGQDIIAGAKSCLSHGCRIVVVTLGKGTKLELGKGTGHRAVTAVAYIRDAENEYVVEPTGKRIPVRDTTGAGDAFATGFLYGGLNNKDLKTCGELGNIVAQFSIARLGAREGLPTLPQLSQRYRELHNEAL